MKTLIITSATRLRGKRLEVGTVVLIGPECTDREALILVGNNRAAFTSQELPAGPMTAAGNPVVENMQTTEISEPVQARGTSKAK